MIHTRLERLTKTYSNGFQAIGEKGISLDLEDGEFVVLLGPSGCGKSTILRMVAGLESITSGNLYINNKRANDVDPGDRNIAMVFQNYALYPHMSVYKNMAYGLKNHGYPRSEIKKRIDETAAILGISHLLNNKPAQLSGGEKQRVAMGRAIARQPVLFLFDEPLSNLDAKLRAHMRSEIKSLQQRLNVTCLYVTHDQVEAMTMASRVVVLNRGCIEQIGSPEEVYRNPRTLFVASFIGSPAINTLEAVCENGVVTCYAQRVPITKKHLPNNAHLVLGVRPEDVLLSKTKPKEPHIVFKAHVVEREHLGAQYLLHLVIEKKGNAHDPKQEYTEGEKPELRVLVHQHEKVEQRVNAYVPLRAVHLYNKEDGHVLS